MENMNENQVKEVEVKELKGLRIGKNWILRNDSMNLVLEQYGMKINPREKDESKRENYGLINKTYHRTLQQVLNYIINNTMYKVDLSDLKKVNAEIVKLQNDIVHFKKIVRLNEDTLEVIDENSNSDRK
jgi:hypothetical protein